MAKRTTDEHLAGESAERIFRAHNGLDLETGRPLRGVGEPAEGCECADCLEYRSGKGSLVAPAASGRSFADVVGQNKK